MSNSNAKSTTEWNGAFEAREIILKTLELTMTALLSDPSLLTADQAFKLKHLLAEGYSHIADFIDRYTN
jgi:enamine deaminase RidA (YjgF/YER057c/UK114 family)